MFSKPSLAVLALATGALAAQHANHAQRHQHLHQKKNLIYEFTTTTTDIVWTTVYVDANGQPVAEPTATNTAAAAVFVPSGASAPANEATTATSIPSVASVASSATESTTVAVPTTTSAVVQPTTLVTSNAAAVVASSAVEEPAAASTTSTDIVAAVAAGALKSETSAATTLAETSAAAAATTTSSAAAAATTASTTSSSTVAKRGAAYNDASLVSALTGTGSKISWAYNWGSSSSGLSDDLEYVPMLWCPTDTYTSSWSANAKAAIAAGSKYILGFNEPDSPSQCDIDASTAATAHKTYMNPYSGQVSIGSPAVTNSNIAGQSLDWLDSWVADCAGACDYSFCPVHWYNTIEAGAADLLDFVTRAHKSCGTNTTIWVTEFAPNVDNPTDAEISSFLGTVQDAFDHNATFSFVERYSYFWVSDGLLVNGDTASTYGNTFAYA